MSDLPALPVGDQPIETSILDEGNPRSVINLLPPSVRDAVKRASVNVPHLFAMDEDTFIKTLREKGIVFTTTDHMLRSQFWIEYHKARNHGRKMVASVITEDACNSDII